MIFDFKASTIPLWTVVWKFILFLAVYFLCSMILFLANTIISTIGMNRQNEVVHQPNCRACEPNFFEWFLSFGAADGSLSLLASGFSHYVELREDCFSCQQTGTSSGSKNGAVNPSCYCWNGWRKSRDRRFEDLTFVVEIMCLDPNNHAWFRFLCYVSLISSLGVCFHSCFFLIILYGSENVLYVFSSFLLILVAIFVCTRDCLCACCGMWV